MIGSRSGILQSVSHPTIQTDVDAAESTISDSDDTFHVYYIHMLSRDLGLGKVKFRVRLLELLQRL